MSKGTPTRTVRISDDEWNEFQLNVTFRNAHYKGSPITMREFLVIAAREKIRKWERSRRRKLTEADEVIDVNQLPEMIAPDLFSDGELDKTEANA